MGTQSLGEFEMLVLLAALRLGADEAYAVSIADTIGEHSGRGARRSAVYITLQRLEHKGLVSTYLGAPTAERGGKARRHVRVEEAGLVALRQTRQALRGMWRGLEDQLEVVP